MTTLLQDFKYALRSLARERAVSGLIVAMLALGIAGNTAIFGVINGLFLRPFPYPEPERLLYLNEQAPQWNLEFTGITYPDFHAWRERNRTFAGMAVLNDESANLSTGEGAERVSVASVSHDLAAVLGIRPVLGRDFTSEDDRPDAGKVVLLGFDLWKSRFGGDPGVLGRSLSLDSEPHTIVGVLPPEAVFPSEAQAWIPLAADPTETGSYYLDGVGRLKPGVTLEQAREDLQRVQEGLWEERGDPKVVSPRLMSLREHLVGELRPATVALLASVGVVLAIACANVASLMLARAAARRREIGVRMALGAGTGRIVRQLLTESLLLSLSGGVLGMALGTPLAGALAAMVPRDLPPWIRFEADLRVLLFCLALTVATAFLFGLAPALQAARADVQAALESSASRGTSAGRRRTLSALVVAEVALALTLLVGGGLLLEAFSKLRRVAPGFRPEGVLTFRLALPESRYPREGQMAFVSRAVERLAELPGVEAAAAVNHVPLAGHSGTFYEAEGAPPPAPGEKAPVVLYRVATPGYFRAMGIELIAGRTFTEADGADEAAPVAIVNETFVRQYWPEGEAVGKRFRNRGSESPWMTVVGVKRDTRHYGLERPMRPGIFMPYRQRPTSDLTLVLRTPGDREGLVNAAREAVRELDPELPLYDVSTMTEMLARSLWLRRAYSWLFGLFAAVALALATGGIYGVLSYAVGQRRREIGIRLALGAQRRQVLGMVLRQGMLLVAVGTGLGLLAAYGAARLMAGLLHGVEPGDPPVYVLVTAALLGVALSANLLPARRAAAIEPATSLRAE